MDIVRSQITKEKLKLRLVSVSFLQQTFEVYDRIWLASDRIPVRRGITLPLFQSRCQCDGLLKGCSRERLGAAIVHSLQASSQLQQERTIRKRNSRYMYVFAIIAVCSD